MTLGTSLLPAKNSACQRKTARKGMDQVRWDWTKISASSALIRIANTALRYSMTAVNARAIISWILRVLANPSCSDRHNYMISISACKIIGVKVMQAHITFLSTRGKPCTIWSESNSVDWSEMATNICKFILVNLMEEACFEMTSLI